MDMDSSMSMPMSFMDSHSTPLYSTAWTPKTPGEYAGTCIFLIVLATILRFLWAAKVLLESKWHAEARQRRYVLVKGKSTEAGKIDSDSDAGKASLITVNGIEENVKVVTAAGSEATPFRLSVDLPRAALFTVIAGVGYLLMLAVMTMNVGYFISILSGTFLGELVIGRYAQAEQH